MTNIRHIPKRRFKEFESDGEWEQEKLGDVTTTFSGGTPTVGIKDYYGGNIPFIRSAEINANFTELFLTKFGLENSSAKMVRKGDILYALYGATSGEVGISKINGAINQAILCIVPEVNYNSDFIMQWLRFQKQNILDQYLQGGQGNLSGAIVKDIKIYFPDYSEQSSIGSFFKTIDSLITLHQHKLDKLKKLKRSYLAELFPAEGERVPKRRFPGFEGEWVEKKLARIATMHARIGWQNLRTSEFLDDGDYYLITGTDFLDGHINFDKCHYVDEKRFQQDKNIQVVNGSILITKDGTLGKVAIVDNLNKPATLNAGVFNVVVKDSNIDVKYLYQYLAAPYLMNYVSKRATGGTIKHLNQNILVDFPIYFPEYKEQKTIGNFLEKLDKSISLQQQKLDKLKDLKKAYLNELFV